MTKLEYIKDIDFLSILLGLEDLPCGGQEPNFDWISELPHLHVHNELNNRLATLRHTKKNVLVSAFTDGTCTTVSDFWVGHFIGKYYHSPQQIHPDLQRHLLSRALEHNTHDGLLFQARQLENPTLSDAIISIATPRYVNTYFRSLLQYLRQIFPIPANETDNLIFLEGGSEEMTAQRHLHSIHCQVQNILNPLLKEICFVIPIKSISKDQLFALGYPMEIESKYKHLMFDDRYYNP